MTAKRIAALLLTLVLAAVTLVSCTGGDHGIGASQVDADAAEEAEITAYVEALALGVDFDGASFTYIGRDDSNFPAQDEETGALLSDSVYYRQRDIETLFGVDWVNKTTRYGDEAQAKVTKSHLAGSSDYDLVYGSMLTVGQPLLMNGAIMSVDGFSHIDLSRDWWAESLEETFMIRDKLFFLTGPIVTNHYSDTSCILFNKDLAEKYSLPGLYELVTEGEWTVDKMLEVAAVVPENTDGTGVYRFGDPGGIEWIFSSGMQIIHFEEDGTPYAYAEPEDKLLCLADKLSAVFGDGDLTCALLHETDVRRESPTEKYGVQSLEELFTDGRALFWFSETGDVPSLRDTDVEFGVLPMPMWDKAQGRYRSYASQWGGAAVYVPENIKDAEMVDIIVEATAALSQKYIKSAFYDKMLKEGSAYDSESRGMLDIVISTKTYDIIDIFSGGDMNHWGSLMTLLDRSICEDSSRLEERYTAEAILVGRYINNVLDMIYGPEE